MSKKLLIAAISSLMTFSMANAMPGAGPDKNDRDRHGDHDRRGDHDDDRDHDKQDNGLRIIGLVQDPGGQRLIRFNEYNPGAAKNINFVSGFTVAGETKLIGIDYRVTDGLLYGVGDKGGLYTINPNTAFLTPVVTLSVVPAGTSFGLDFNPTTGKLRIISDTGNNYAVDIPSGTVTTDHPLLYPPGVPPATGVTGAAYTNNDIDPNTGTTLFDISSNQAGVADPNINQVAIQSPPASGALVATGKLFVDATPDVGFDIFTAGDGSNYGFASLITAADGKARFYEVDLLTGKATSRGKFKNTDKVIDIAVPLAP